MAKVEKSYLAIVPVAHLVLEDLLLLGLEGLTNAEPAATDGARNVANATLLLELAGNVLVRVALLLEVDNARVIGVVVSLDRLRACGLSSRDADVGVVGELVALVRIVDALQRAMKLAECRGWAPENSWRAFYLLRRWMGDRLGL